MIVSEGLTERVFGNSEASPTKSRFASCDSQLASTTERAGSEPIRQVPWTWVLAGPVQATCLAPAASITRRPKSRPFSIRSSSTGSKWASKLSEPSSPTTTRPLFSSLASTRMPFQWRYWRTASVRRSPHIGPSSSAMLVANPIGS